MKKISGIYEIRNKINNRCYIGSSYDIYKRWTRHKQQLRQQKHHNLFLQRAWNKYGSENFEFNIIVAVDERFLEEEEQKYINQNKNGYNIAIVVGNGMKGRKHRSDTLAKLAKIRLGVSPINKGQKMSPEIYEKYMAGRPEMTEEYRQKIINGRKKTYESVCPNGHIRTQENTKFTKKGWRCCLDCRQIQNIKRREKRKLSKLENKEK